MKEKYVALSLYLTSQLTTDSIRKNYLVSGRKGSICLEDTEPPRPLLHLGLSNDRCYFL